VKTRDFKPGDVIGYLRSGRPIRLIGGGSADALPEGWQNQVTAPAAQIPVQAPADMPPMASPAPQPTTGRLFTEEDVERFRRQERDKYYRELERYKSEVSELSKKLAAWEEEREKARREAEEAARRAAEKEMSAKELIEARQREWEERFRKLEQEREAERAALEKERRFAALQAYIQRRAREEQLNETVAPELIPLITGNSEDEVEECIQRLRQATESITQNVQAAMANQTPPAPPRGVSPAGYTATGPMDDSAQQQLTPEAIKNMSMAEYAKIRPLLGLDAQPRNRGLFG